MNTNRPFICMCIIQPVQYVFCTAGEVPSALDIHPRTVYRTRVPLPGVLWCRRNGDQQDAKCCGERLRVLLALVVVLQCVTVGTCGASRGHVLQWLTGGPGGQLHAHAPVCGVAVYERWDVVRASGLGVCLHCLLCSGMDCRCAVGGIRYGAVCSAAAKAGRQART